MVDSIFITDILNPLLKKSFHNWINIWHWFVNADNLFLSQDNLGFKHALLKYDVSIKGGLSSVDNSVGFLGLLVELKPLKTGHLDLMNFQGQ